MGIGLPATGMDKKVNMSQANKFVQNKNRYRVEGFHIIDSSTPSKKFYIREILDSGSAEYSSSKLTDQQKLEIISKLGLEPLTAVLGACYRSCNKGYDANDTAQLAFLLLNKTAYG